MEQKINAKAATDEQDDNKDVREKYIITCLVCWLQCGKTELNKTAAGFKADFVK